jgi:hypothetical protein
MIDKIVGFGCSWIAGDEIEHPNPTTDKERRVYREQNCTLGQFASMLGVKKVFNHGISGGSLQSTMWEFVKYSEHFDENTLVVVGLTESSRQSWYNCDDRSPYMHSHWNHPEHTWNEFIKFYIVHSDCEQLWNMNLKIASSYFDSYCKANGVKLLQFKVFPTLIEVPGVAQWNARSYVQSMHNKHGDCLAPGHHPNEKGSKFLAERLLKQAESAKLI